MIGKIIKIVDKIVAVFFLLLFTLVAMVWMNKPEWLIVLAHWFVLAYLMIKYVLLGKGLTRNETKTIFQKILYIFDRLLLFGEIALVAIGVFGKRGEEFIFFFVFWLLEIYIFGKYILLKKPKENK